MSALIIINPNASQVVTDGIDTAVDPLRRFGIPIRCMAADDGFGSGPPTAPIG